MSTTVEGAPAARAFKPTNAQVVEFLKLHAIFGETQRYLALDRREAFQKCLEYKHQTTDWFGDPAESFETISAQAMYPAGTQPTGGQKLNARQKRPTAPTRKGKTTVQRFTDMLLSNARRPKVLVDQDPDTAAFLEAVQESGNFWAAMRMARNKGGAMKSVVVTAHVREAQWCFEVHNSKHCTPIWKDKRTWSLAGLLVMYRTQREENAFDDEGKPAGTRMVDYLVRRIITENDDIVYKEISVEEAMANPEKAWEIEGDLAVNHNLGRFPGVWIQNIADEEDPDGGGGDCEGAYETIDTNDRLIAQMFFGTLPNLDPTVITKTDPHEVQQIDSVHGMQKGSEFAIEVGKSGDAKYMEMTGAGVTVALALSEKLERQIDLITGAVFPDDTDIAQATSAKAIELRFAPMISRCDDLRGQYGAAIIQLMRIVIHIAQRFLNASIRLPAGPDGQPRIGKFRFDMPPRKTQVAQADGTMKDVIEPHKLGPGGYMSLKWGAYFAPTENDIQSMVANSSQANASGFIAKVTAARRIADVFGVQDVEGEVARARAEGQEDAERALYGMEGGVRMERAIVQGGDDSAGGESGPGAGDGGKP